MHRLADGTLVVLVGASGSGKSTWAAEHFPPEAILSSDRLRAVVGEGEHDQTANKDAFAVLDRIAQARLRRGLTTVVDSTGLERVHRDGWRALAAAVGAPCIAVAFDTPAADCRRRNAARERSVPSSVLSSQLSAYAQQRPGLESEGFAEVIAAQPVRVVAPSVAAAAAQLPHATATTAARERPTLEVSPAHHGSGPLRFGLQLSSFALPGGPDGRSQLRDRLADVACRAEDAGFSSIWLMDHLRQIPQVGRAWEDIPESVATLGYLAGVTRTATIGALVHCVTLRNVGLLAKSLATIDVLSGGRAWCGLGAGWFEAEHAAYGLDFPSDRERLDLLEETLQALPLLWGKGSPAFQGRHVHVPEALAYPRPLQARIPILVGGQGERRTLRLAAQYGDACNLTGDVDAVRRKVAVLHRHCEDVGRDPSEVEVTHLSTALVAADEAELDAAVARRRPSRGVPRWTAWVNPGTVEDHVLRARHLREVGVQHLVVSLDDLWESAAIERFAEVIARLR